MTAMRRVFFSYQAEKKACEGPVMKKKHKRNALLAQGVLVSKRGCIRPGCRRNSSGSPRKRMPRP